MVDSEARQPARKKPRIFELRRADGFDVPPKQKRTKIPVPPFVSAFDDGDINGTRKKAASLRGKLDPAGASMPGFKISAPLESEQVSKNKITSFLPNPPVPPSVHASKIPFTSKDPTRPLRHAQPPILPTKRQPERNSGTPDKLSRYAIDPPVFAALHAALEPKTPTKIKPSRPLNGLPGPPPRPPPPHPRRSVPPDKRMHTISTTRIARATNLSTENGAAELASLFLYDQHPDLVRAAAQDNENGTGVDGFGGKWSIGMSPQKNGKWNDRRPRLVSGGLAARAESFISQFNTSLALWQRDVENQISCSSSSALRLRPPPDLQLRIIEILHPPRGLRSRSLSSSSTSTSTSPKSKSSTLSSSSASGLALCHIVSLSSSMQKQYPRLRTHQTLKQVCRVVFTFPSAAPSRFQPHPQPRKGDNNAAPLHPRNPEDFAQGRHVQIWAPLQVFTPLPSPLSASNSVGGVKREDGEDSDARLVPAPFPFISTPVPTPTLAQKWDEPIAETVLICSRFLILR